MGKNKKRRSFLLLCSILYIHAQWGKTWKNSNSKCVFGRFLNFFYPSRFHSGTLHSKKFQKNIDFSLWGKQCIIVQPKWTFFRFLAHCEMYNKELFFISIKKSSSPSNMTANCSIKKWGQDVKFAAHSCSLQGENVCIYVQSIAKKDETSLQFAMLSTKRGVVMHKKALGP